MNKKVQTVKGMQDMLPDDLAKIEHIESLFFKTAERYGFIRVQTPIVEFAELYSSTCEFPEERCYSLNDSKGRKLVLRSDPDAPLARLVTDNFRYAPKPIKLAFCGSIFRSWNHRRREFRMFSLNTFGLDESAADVEILRVIADVIESVGFPGYRVEFNNLQFFRRIISASGIEPLSPDKVGDILYSIRFAPDSESIIKTLISRHVSRNTIDAILELLECHDDESRIHDVVVRLSGTIPSLLLEFEKTMAFKMALTDLGMRHSKLNVANLHGTGFYSGLTYRLFPKNGSREIGDGGRYDHMVQQMNNEPMPATGIGLGIERFVELMEVNGCPIKLPPKARSVIVSYADASLASRCRPTLQQLRLAGCIVEEDLANRGFDKTVRYARSKRYNRAVLVNTSESKKGFHLRVVNLDDESGDSVVISTLEELYNIMLKC